MGDGKVMGTIHTGMAEMHLTVRDIEAARHCARTFAP